MKEKIGIEKLIELLNEYENTDSWENGHQVEFRESKIISKKFGFIKWLVENDKIDIKKVKINWLNYVNDEILENKILMLLAIQDEPIKYLCEILK